MAKPRSRVMKGRREMVSIYLQPEVADAIRDLSASRDIPTAQLMREAASDVLTKYGVKIPKAKAKRGS